MKIRSLLFGSIAAIAAAIGLATLPGCQTPEQAVAGSVYYAGSAFATYELGQAKTPAAAASVLKGLQDLATALPNIPLGKVTPYQMGVLNAELQPIQAAAVSTAPQLAQYSGTYSQIGNAISALSQINAGATGGNPTASTGLIIAQFTDFANGLNEGIQFYNGQQSVGAPATAAPAPAK